MDYRVTSPAGLDRMIADLPTAVICAMLDGSRPWDAVAGAVRENVVERLRIELLIRSMKL